MAWIGARCSRNTIQRLNYFQFWSEENPVFFFVVVPVEFIQAKTERFLRTNRTDTLGMWTLNGWCMRLAKLCLLVGMDRVVVAAVVVVVVIFCIHIAYWIGSALYVGKNRRIACASIGPSRTHVCDVMYAKMWKAPKLQQQQQHKSHKQNYELCWKIRAIVANEQAKCLYSSNQDKGKHNNGK